jgi:Atypical PilZ domain, cyclic di-GMP receptor
MPESFLGDGLIFKESLPLVFTPGPLLEGLGLVNLNADNHQLLGAESSLDDVRVHESLKDESPALLHELQRLEFKLNIVLRLVAELTVRSHPAPLPQRVNLSSRGLEWFGADAPAIGVTGLLRLYINPALPQPLQIPCEVAADRTQDSVRVAQLRFEGLSETVVELLDKLIFRHHRRLIASARLAAN